MVLSSCQFIQRNFGGKERPVARVYDKELYPSDLKGLVPKGSNAKDSALIIDAYINNWIRQTVTLKQAEENVEYNNEEIEKKLQSYRNSLIIYSYEQQLVAQRLDTGVSMKEIEEYYRLNSSNFELKKSIVKASYAKIPKSALKVDLARKWFRSTKEKDRMELETYCIQFASVYSLADTAWLFYDQLQNIVPLNHFSESSVLQKNNYIDFSDDSFVYLVRIRDFMYREDTSPLEFEIDNIRNIIINKRKVELINKMENDVYKKALNDHHIEIYKD